MIQVRTKDKIFLAVALPLALLAAYVWLVRQPLATRTAALAAEQRNLPDEDSFPAEKRRLQRRLADAEAELAAEKAEKSPEVAVKGDPESTAAARQDAVLAVFTSAGAKVLHVQPPQAETPPEDVRGDAVLRATGRCPAPEMRQFMLEADYAVVTSVLKTFADRQTPVVPESVSLNVDGRTCRWEMTLWL